MTELLEVIDARIERSAGVYDRTLDELAGLHEELERLGAMRELAAGLDEPVAHDEPTPAPAVAPLPPAGPQTTATRVTDVAVTANDQRPAVVKRVERSSDTTDRVVHAVADLGPCSVDDVVQRTHLGKSTVKKALQSLVNGGELVATGATRARRYQTQAAADAAAASPDRTITKKPMAALLRDVNATIVNDPGLTEDQLALALNVDREDVAVATGELLSREWIVLRPDGTYEPADDTAEEPLAA